MKRPSTRNAFDWDNGQPSAFRSDPAFAPRVDGRTKSQAATESAAAIVQKNGGKHPGQPVVVSRAETIRRLHTGAYSQKRSGEL